MENNHTDSLNGNLLIFGIDLCKQLSINKVIQISNLKAKQISAGSVHIVLIDSEDNIWSFGSNLYGELGIGDTLYINIPTQIPNLKAQRISTGLGNTIIIDLDNNVWSFGYNRNGQLGLGDNENRNTKFKSQTSLYRKSSYSSNRLK
jgi:alpha-tubulin suppressor-like RCC1 family protein